MINERGCAGRFQTKHRSWVAGLALGTLLLGLCAGEAAQARTPQHPFYVVFLDPQDPAKAVVELHLPEGQNRTLILRAPLMQLASQVADVSCDGRALTESLQGWPIPDDCGTSRWTISLDQPHRGSVVPSDQRSMRMPGGGVLISEPTSLLRLAGHDGPGSVQLADQPGARTLPSLNEPPGFYVMGDAPTLRFSETNPRLIYVGADLDSVLDHVDPRDHLRAIAYFRNILGDKAARSVEDLTVVWFGASRERREASGAAGYDVLLANFITPAEDPTPFELALPLVLVLHEQFHQIQGGSGAHPHWVSESLANYYALKAARTHLSWVDGVDDVWRFFIDSEATASTGLLEIQRQIDEDQDFSGYDQFYTVGAAFWATLDRALSNATAGRRTLDDILPVIVASDFTTDPELPRPVLDALSEIHADELLRLTRRYLLGQDA